MASTLKCPLEDYILVRTKLFYILVLLVALWLRTADLKTIPPGIYYDEGRDYQRIWRLMAGYSLPMYFQDINEPFDVMIRAVYLSVSGGINMFMAQMFSIWLNMLTVAATIAAARLLYKQYRWRSVMAFAAGLTLAAMPPAVMVGRHIYESNWLPPTSAGALFFLILAWRKQQTRYYVLAGIMTALAASFYLSGLFFPPAVIVVMVAMVLVNRRWPSLKNLALMVISFGITMIPWLYLYLSIPNWLVRVTDLIDEQSPLKNPAVLIRNIGTAFSTLFVPDAIHDMRYNTFTTAFLNPALIVLFAVGVLVSLRRWKIPMILAPLLIGLVMVTPNILSSEPYQPGRLMGVFVPLSLLTGLGSGAVWGFMQRSPIVQRTLRITLVVVFVGTPIYTAYHVWYHFKVQPLLTNPNVPVSFALKYRIGFQNLLDDIAASDQPTYLPIEYLNTDLAVAVLRPYDFPTVRAYDGRPLPAGRVILPVNSIIYGFFLLDHTPVQYGLLLPKSGEILILPPISPDDAAQLEQQTRNGADVINNQGWVLGQSVNVTEGSNPFERVHVPTVQSLGVFDDNLELVGIDAPAELTAGKIAPITLFWRVNAKTGKDYFSRLQVWDYGNTSEGYERGSPLVKEPDFPLNILYNIYPTVMWQPGEIVADTRWIPVFADAPSGGYRFAIGVYDYPGPSPVAMTTVNQVSQQQDNWLLAGRSSIGLSDFTAPSTENDNAFAELGSQIRLTGYHTDLPVNALKAGDTLTVDLDWQATHPIGESYIVFLHVTDATGNIVAQQDALPFEGVFPTWAWPLGAKVSTHYTLTIPEDAQVPFNLTAGMYSYPSLERLSVTQDGEVSPDSVITIPGS